MTVSLRYSWATRRNQMPWIDRLISDETRRFLNFGASSTALTVANMVGGILTLRWIPPETMGAWQAMLLLQVYCDALKLGVLNGMNREFPYRMGQGDQEAAMLSLGTTLAWIRIGTGLGLAAHCGLAVINWDKGTIWQLAVVAGAAQWALSYHSTYVQATLRGGDDFSRLAIIQYINAAVGLLLIPLVAIWGFGGFCARTVIQAGILSAMLGKVMRYRPTARLDMPEFKRLLATGVPLFVASYIFQLSMNAERSALVDMGQERLLGLFAPVSAILSAVLVLPNAASLYVYPSLSRGYGRDGDKQDLWRKAWQSTKITVILAILASAFCWFAAEPLTLQIFPQYIESVPAMKIAALSGVFMAFRTLTTVLPAISAWYWHYAWILTFAILKFALCHLLPGYSSSPLTAVAQAGLIASFTTSVLMIYCVRKATR